VLINQFFMGAIIMKLDRDRNLMNADITWTQQFDRKSVEPVQKHVYKSVSKELFQNITQLSC